VDDDETAAVRGILDRAAAETRELRHGFIGSEHLLLALFGAPGGRAARRLEAAGAGYEAVRAQIVRIVGVGDEPVSAQQILPYTPHAVAVVRQVRREAERSRSEAIGTEHVLRAVLRRRESLAVSVLEECGVDPRSLADELRHARSDDE